MFMGEYNHTIDGKGRVIVPAKFRDALGDGFVVTKGLDGCLFVYPPDAWQAFEEKLQSLPLTNKNSRQFARFFLAGAASCEKEVVMVGVANRVEIWSKERWQECIDSYDDDMDEVAENMESLGFSI